MKTYEVVISGMSGTFPECPNAKQLETAAYLGQNLVSENHSKWPKDGLSTTINAVGKIKDPFKFDTMFFGIHAKLNDCMDMHCKHHLEKTYEAICDAGLNPHDLRGEKVAVAISSMISESENNVYKLLKNSHGLNSHDLRGEKAAVEISAMISETEKNVFKLLKNSHGMLGQSKSMQANRISYFYDFTGPSFYLDTSWVGPMQALVIAHDLIAKGCVKMAIVGGGNIMLHPEMSLQYEGLAVLNPDGKTKSYSANADGYSRSEGVVVFVLQRASEAIRSYGTVIKASCQTEMNHKSLFTERNDFTQFLKEFYSDIPSYIKEKDIAYIEGDGSASLVTDAMELNGLDEVLCPGRKKPLLVGSCKSLLGHTESCSAFTSVVSALIAMKTGYIPPVLHFSENNPLVPALNDGRIKIVTERTKLEGDYIGVSTFALSSIYSHVLLKRNPKSIGIRDNSYFPPDGIPRLFLLSGRDQNIMKKVLKKIEEEPVNEYYYALNHNVFKSQIPRQMFRGIAIVEKEKSFSEIEEFESGKVQPIWFVFAGMGSQWLGMGAGIMEIPVIRRSIERSHEILLSKGLDLINIVTTNNEKIFSNILHSFVGIAAIQIALVDLLEEMGICPDGIIGHSVGELGCSYADKGLTAEQVILAAYARGKASNDATLIRGMMAAVGKSYKDIKDELPEGIEVACHNSNISCTLSGPSEIMETYVEGLQTKGVFARLVSVANIAYHSKHIAPAAPYLLKYLKELIPNPKPRSSKWISSSVPEDKWDTELATYCSAEYHTNNLLSYVLFEEASAHIPKNAICIEIAPHGLLQAIIKKSLPSCVHVSLTSWQHKKGCSFLINALGRLYLSGVEMDLAKLYPPVDFPVPREVDYLHQIITWFHDEEALPSIITAGFATATDKRFSRNQYLFRENSEEARISPENYMLQGTSLYPKARLMNVLMSLMMAKVKDKSSVTGYHFESVKFLSDLTFNEASKSNVQSMHQSSYGKFEMTTEIENVKALINGKLNLMEAPLPPTSLPSDWSVYNGQKTLISGNQIYDYFSEKECFFRGPYRNISCITITERGFNGKIKWMGDNELFLDGIFRLFIFYMSILKDTLVDVSSVQEILFDPSSLPENDAEIDIYFDDRSDELAGEGVRMKYIKSKPMNDFYSSSMMVNNRYFSPYGNIHSNVDMAELCLQLIRGNSGEGHIDVQLVFDESSRTCNRMLDAFLSKPLQELMFNIRIRNAKQATFIPEAVCGIKFNGGYLIISENKTPEIIKILLDLDIPLYVLHSGDAPKDVGKLSELYIQHSKDNKVVLYKKKISSISRHNYVALSDNYLNELKKTDPKSNKITVYNYKYSSFSEIVNILRSIAIDSDNMRFVFIDEAAPPFNQSHKFYKDQLMKDLKINIASGDKWGSFTDKPMPTMQPSAINVNYSKMPINCIRCSAVDLKVVGLNLINSDSPFTQTKFGVIEYSGKLGKDEVFGFGKLSDDYHLEVDKILHWKKPMHWTNEQAATVPLFYAMAYQLLYVKSKEIYRPYESLLIHSGHTPFSQAVIYVALSMDIKVFTTCYSETQKQFILNKFPQIAKHNVLIIIKGSSKDSLLSFIRKSTDGEGVKIVVDTLEEFDMRIASIQCTGMMGRYCYVNFNDVDALRSCGLASFQNEKCVSGFNPDLICDLVNDEKKLLAEIVQSGINNHTVKPLDNYTIQEFCSEKQATDIIIENRNSSQPTKVLMVVDKKQSLLPYKTKTKELAGKKNYVIVGSYNSIWFDITKWLVSRGAESIQIVLNQDILQITKIRYNHFIKKHKYVKITLTGTENLNTAPSCKEFIKKLNDRHSIDILFYLKPGFEKQMTNLDLALRTYSKSTYLVSIGVDGCKVTEKWKRDGYNGIAFILKRDDLKNKAIVSLLDDWLRNWDPIQGFVTVDKYADNALHKYSDIIPVDASELLDLYYASDNLPSLKETSTRSLPSNAKIDTNPVIIFPGLKMAKAEEFAKKLLYPTYVAKYPLMIKSLTELASQFSKLLIEKLDQNIFTLIAEGWSGPLVLCIAKLLEDNGKISEVILLDAAPRTIEQWPSHIMKSKIIISKYLPSTRKDDKLTVNNLKSIIYQISESMARESYDCTQDEILLGLETLANRLEVINEFSLNDIKIKSIIHLFTPENTENDIKELDQISLTQPCKHHIMKDVDCKSFLQCPKLIEDINNLALVEYKNCAVKQKVGVISTLDVFDF